MRNVDEGPSVHDRGEYVISNVGNNISFVVLTLETYSVCGLGSDVKVCLKCVYHFMEKY